MIIAKGSDVNARNNAGDTALHIAVRQQLRAQGEALLLAKADIFAANVHGGSPLSLALTAPGGPVEWLFTPATLAARDPNGDTPLHHAAKRNLAQAVEFLAQKGAALDAANSAGETALHQAVKADASDAARSLLALGAPLSARDAMGDTPLHAAVLWAARKSLPILVAAGADLNARDFAGETPLHQAVRKRDRDSLRYLLSKGADPDARDNRGTAPLRPGGQVGGLRHRARSPRGRRGDRRPRPGGPDRPHRGGQPRRRRVHADPRGRRGGHHGARRPRRIPADRRHQAESRPSPVRPHPSQHQPRRPRRQERLRIIVEAKPAADALSLAIATGAKLDARDRFAATSLHAALRAEDRDTAGRLAKAGSDVFARDKDGDTPRPSRWPRASMPSRPS